MALSDQVPVHSGFGAKSTGAEVLADRDLAGKVAIVTGGYSGIGLETVRALASKGARVIVPVRDRAKAGPALSDIVGEVETADLDLGHLGSVRLLAAHLAASLPRLDLLINNAGIMACPETRVGPGWEAQFATNHLGHMALALGLMGLLMRTDGARVVALSSTGHKISGVRWDDLHFRTAPYDKWQAYGQSKTADALFANALSRRLKASGGLAFAVHPGGIFTPLQRHLGVAEQVRLGWINEDGTPSELAKAGFKTHRTGLCDHPVGGDQPGPGRQARRLLRGLRYRRPDGPLQPVRPLPWRRSPCLRRRCRRAAVGGERRDAGRGVRRCAVVALSGGAPLTGPAHATGSRQVAELYASMARRSRDCTLLRRFGVHSGATGGDDSRSPLSCRIRRRRRVARTAWRAGGGPMCWPPGASESASCRRRSPGRRARIRPESPRASGRRTRPCGRSCGIPAPS